MEFQKRTRVINHRTAFVFGILVLHRELDGGSANTTTTTTTTSSSSTAAHEFRPSSLGEGVVHFSESENEAATDNTSDSASVASSSANNKSRSFNFVRKFRERRTTTSSDTVALEKERARKRRTSTPHQSRLNEEEDDEDENLAVETGIEVLDDNTIMDLPREEQDETPSTERDTNSQHRLISRIHQQGNKLTTSTNDSTSANRHSTSSSSNIPNEPSDSCSTSLHSAASRTDMTDQHNKERNGHHSAALNGDEQEEEETSTPGAETVTCSAAALEPPITARNKRDQHTEVGSIGEQILNSIPLVHLAGESHLNYAVRMSRRLVERYRRIPLKKYRICALIALAAITLVSPGFVTGVLWGFYIAAILFLYVCVSDPIKPHDIPPNEYEELLDKIKEECMKEENPAESKIYKGWMNILDERYNPHTFHINAVQTVLVRLDGKMLRISRPDRAMLKHGFHNDPTLTESEPRMIAQQIYDLTNAVVKLRPRRLARRRWFSRRYPICIRLSAASNDFLAREMNVTSTITDVPEVRGSEEAAENEGEKDETHDAAASSSSPPSDDNVNTPTAHHTSPTIRQPYPNNSQLNLVEVGREADGYLSDTEDSAAEEEPTSVRHSHSDANISNASSSTSLLSRFRRHTNARQSRSNRPSRTIYLFARCAREKERWFHRLRRACYRFVLPMDTSEDRSVMLNRRFSLPSGVPLEQEPSRDYFLYILHSLQFNKHLEKLLFAETSMNSERNGVVLMDMGRMKWHEPTERSGRELVLVANLLASRVFYDFCRDKYWCSAVQNKIQNKLASIHLPYFIDTLELSSFNIGTAIPLINQIYTPVVDEWGIWVDFEIKYEGLIKLALETRVNLMRIKEQHDSTDTTSSPIVGSLANLRPLSRYSDSSVPESPETSPDEDYGSKVKFNSNTDSAKERRKGGGRKMLHLIDKFTNSDFFKGASELKPIRKMMEEISSTRLMLNVEVTKLEGIMTVNIATPPSDRLWYAFRRPPQMSIKAVPQIGDRTVVFSTLSDWIEKKMTQLLEKNLVVPNMDDIIIPVMSGNNLLQGPINQ